MMLYKCKFKRFTKTFRATSESQLINFLYDVFPKWINELETINGKEFLF